MGKEVVYCSGCGRRLLEIDFKQKRAFELGNRVACADCRKAVQQEIMEESKREGPPPVSDAGRYERPPEGLPGATATPSVRPAPAGHAGRAGPKPLRRTGTPNRPRKEGPRWRASRVPLLSAGIGSAAGIFLLILLMLSESEPPPPPSAKPAPTDRWKRERRARRIVDELAAAVREDPSAFGEHLRRIESARPKVEHTAAAPRLEKIEADLRKLREDVLARTQEIHDLLRQVEEITRNFQDFGRHRRIRRLLDRAETLANEPVRVGEYVIKLQDAARGVRRARSTYRLARRKKGNEVIREARTKVDRLKAEGRLSEAMEVIDRVPDAFNDLEGFAELQGEKQRIHDQLGIGRWQNAFDGSIRGWTRIQAPGEKAANWTVQDGILVGRSSHGPGDGYGDRLFFGQEFREFEMVIEFEHGAKGALQVQVRARATARGLQRPGESVVVQSAGPAVLVTLEENTLSVSGQEPPHRLRGSVAESGKIVLSLKHGAAVRTRRIRTKRLR